MKRKWTAGWTRIPELEFKAMVAEALRREPGLSLRLKLALIMTAMSGGVQRDVRDRYLGWVREVEAALAAETASAVPVPASPIELVG